MANDKAINEAYATSKQKSDSKGKSKEILKHLVEGLTSDKEGMIALGYDCLKEAVALIPNDKQDSLVKKWDDYFANDPEFADLEKGKVSKKLQGLYDNEVKPMMM